MMLTWPGGVQLPSSSSTESQQLSNAKQEHQTILNHPLPIAQVDQLVQPTATANMGVKNTVSGVIGRVERLVNRVVSPDTRSQFYTNIATFANAQPILAVSQNQLNSY